MCLWDECVAGIIKNIKCCVSFESGFESECIGACKAKEANLCSNIKLTLNSWEEQSLLRMHYFFCVSLGMNCCILLRILVCMFLRDTCPQFTFLVIS